MSQENVEIVAGIYEAFAHRDNEAPFDVYADDIVWDQSRGFTEGTEAVYRGHDGVREAFRSLLAAFSVIDFALEDIRSVADRVLVTVHEYYRGRTSGVEVERRHYVVFTLAQGKITRMQAFIDRDEALAAVGLSA